jgi:hypothetical protein
MKLFYKAIQFLYDFVRIFTFLIIGHNIFTYVNEGLQGGTIIAALVTIVLSIPIAVIMHRLTRPITVALKRKISKTV